MKTKKQSYFFNFCLIISGTPLDCILPIFLNAVKKIFFIQTVEEINKKYFNLHIRNFNKNRGEEAFTS